MHDNHQQPAAGTAEAWSGDARGAVGGKRKRGGSSPSPEPAEVELASRLARSPPPPEPAPKRRREGSLEAGTARPRTEESASRAPQVEGAARRAPPSSENLNLLFQPSAGHPPAGDLTAEARHIPGKAGQPEGPPAGSRGGAAGDSDTRISKWVGDRGETDAAVPAVHVRAGGAVE
ncbi:hypothetical protein DFJ73DRAFT_960263 [Zopfochytrium polystomum]|nr:hypothetical protein DFJ73DRAFT_960263 [Zopfochytrium polystomum]